MRWKRAILGVVLVTLVAPVQGEYADVVLNKRAELAGMRPVIYPHWFHRIRFRCKVCHKELGFNMRVGSNDVTMADIMDGKFCGMCHNGNVAWSAEHCDRCHSGYPGLETGIQGGHATTGPGQW
ncbi:MAG: hypothetical protein HQL55_06125 [Magnetococcales bacterium]|nr:hypothetical protein [Magnetococcales bacterium]